MLQDWQTTDPKSIEELVHTILAHIEAQEYTIKILKDALRKVQDRESPSNPPR